MEPVPRQTSRIRQMCFERWYIEQDGRIYLPCHCDACGGHPFDPAREKWEAAHMVPRALGGSDGSENVRPMRYKCHRGETYNKDNPGMADGRRVSRKYYGVKRSGKSR